MQKLLVHPDARRHGLARALMQRVELEAVQAGRSLLTLDTRAGHAAEHLYRDMGWQEAGRIPGYAVANADGTPWRRHGVLLEENVSCVEANLSRGERERSRCPCTEGEGDRVGTL